MEIDITDLVEKARSTFVIAAKEFIMAQALAIPGLGAFVYWLIRNFLGPILDWALTSLSNWDVMQAFFMNTALRKASEAGDYVKTVNLKDSLPDTATDEEYERAEQNEISAFNAFVRVTN